MGRERESDKIGMKSTKRKRDEIVSGSTLLRQGGPGDRFLGLLAQTLVKGLFHVF